MSTFFNCNSLLREEFHADKCVICCVDDGEVLVSVREKEAISLLTASSARNCIGLLEYLHTSPSHILVHVSCRKRFTDANQLKKCRSELKSPLNRPLRSTSAPFNWKDMLCVEKVDTTGDVRQVMTLELEDALSTDDDSHMLSSRCSKSKKKAMVSSILNDDVVDGFSKTKLVVSSTLDGDAVNELSKEKLIDSRVLDDVAIDGLSKTKLIVSSKLNDDAVDKLSGEKLVVTKVLDDVGAILRLLKEKVIVSSVLNDNADAVDRISKVGGRLDNDVLAKLSNEKSNVFCVLDNAVERVSNDEIITTGKLEEARDGASSEKRNASSKLDEFAGRVLEENLISAIVDNDATDDGVTCQNDQQNTISDEKSLNLAAEKRKSDDADTSLYDCFHEKDDSAKQDVVPVSLSSLFRRCVVKLESVVEPSSVISSPKIVLNGNCIDSSKTKSSCELKACVFCQLFDNNPELYGELQHHKSISAHYFCVLFTSALTQRGECDTDPLWGFDKADIIREAKRSRQLKCIYCLKKGASIGCCFPKCRAIFHYPCGVAHHAVNQYFGTFKSFCHKHHIKQKMPACCRASESVTCFICLADLGTRVVSQSVIILPCCLGALLHRKCMQQLAASAGMHHFKCPLCNDRVIFVDKMLKLGIYIPDQDAAWEMERNAYHELLERHSECDVRSCLCSDGRRYRRANSRWSIVLCRCCGSQGTHVFCSNLSGNQTWVCNTCAIALKRNLKKGRKIRPKSAKALGSQPIENSVQAHRQRQAEDNYSTDNTSGEEILTSCDVQPCEEKPQSNAAVKRRRGGPLKRRADSESDKNSTSSSLNSNALMSNCQRQIAQRRTAATTSGSENVEYQMQSEEPVPSRTVHTGISFFKPNATVVKFQQQVNCGRSDLRSKRKPTTPICAYTMEGSGDASKLHLVHAAAVLACGDNPTNQCSDLDEPLSYLKKARTDNSSDAVDTSTLIDGVPSLLKRTGEENVKVRKSLILSIPRLPCNLIEVKTLARDDTFDQNDWNTDEGLRGNESSSCFGASKKIVIRRSSECVDVDVCDYSSCDSVHSAMAERLHGCARARVYKRGEKHRTISSTTSTKKSPRIADSMKLKPVRRSSIDATTEVSTVSVPVSRSHQAVDLTGNISENEVYQISDSESNSGSIIALYSLDDDSDKCGCSDDDDVVWILGKDELTPATAGNSVIDLTSSDKHVTPSVDSSSVKPAGEASTACFGNITVHVNAYRGSSVDVTARPLFNGQNHAPVDVSHWLAQAVPYAFL